MYVRMHSPGNLRSFDDEPRNQRDKRCTFSLRTLAAQRIRQENTLQHTESELARHTVVQAFEKRREGSTHGTRREVTSYEQHLHTVCVVHDEISLGQESP